MEEKYAQVLEKRKNNIVLQSRLSLYSELIYCALQQLNDNNKKTVGNLLNTLIRKSSELQHYTKTTDFIPNEFSRTKERHEHIVPCAVIKNHFINHPNIGKEEIKDILLKNGLRALISNEDNKLIDVEHRTKMPIDWDFGKNPLIRYNKIIDKIKIRTS